jgi:hypothetical protein
VIAFQPSAWNKSRIRGLSCHGSACWMRTCV